MKKRTGPEVGPAADDPLAVIDGWPGAAAVAVVGPEGIRTARGALHDTFAWASVTKILTTMAVLVATEEGSVELDEPAGPAGSTLRHLLAHASGLARDDNRVSSPPGTRRLYSNRGIEVAALTLEAATGVDIATYVSEAVLHPLQMTATRLEGSAASGACGPLVDLAALARELTAPTLIAPATLEAATTAVAFPDLAGVLPGFGLQDPNDWGVGFEIRGHKQPHWTGTTNSPATFGHFGLSGSFLWVDPDLALASVGLAGRDFGPWAKEAWPALADAIVARWGRSARSRAG